jgi:hypothetical protein
MSRQSTAASVRERKNDQPHLYCPEPRCLWLVVHRDSRITPCPKHPDAMHPDHAGAERHA